MNPADYTRIKEIVVAARERTGAERIAYLDATCGDDAALRREVESLLAHDRGEPGMMRTGGAEVPADLARELDEPLPETIGPYRILGVLGEGGMGVVYRAEQTEPIRREVALKLVRRGMDTKRVVARFEAERQTLAMMDHTHIARVLDAGADASGRPYFVMELVRGTPLTVYSDEHRLGLRERILLFLPVCQAVQHAHQKGIIHRDLKPSNVLVTVEDGQAVPKIIDFGIAKAVESSPFGQSLLTLDGQMVGTPEYMSPEQAGIRKDIVDTRTDVYSLGVILYELLAGALPFAFDEETSLAGWMRSMQEMDAPRPSTRVAELGEAGPGLAGKRRLDPGTWRRRLQSDLDWIVLKAMEPDPGLRYPAASELAADLLRYLEDQPVEAGRPGTGYRLRKFARRNRAGVVAGVLVLAALVTGAVGTTWQAIHATRQKARAEARLVDIQRFVHSMVFGVHDRISTLPGSTPAREYIVTTAVEYLDDIASDPGDAARLREPLASAYRQLGSVQEDLGQTEAAVTSYTRAVDFARALVADRPTDATGRRTLARSLDELAAATGSEGKIELALETHVEAIGIYRGLVAEFPDSLDYLRELSRSEVRAAYCSVRTGRVEDAIRYGQEAVRNQEPVARAYPEDAEAQIALAFAYAYLGESLAENGEDEASLENYRRSADIFDRQLRADPQNPRLLNYLGVTLGAVSLQEMVLGDLETALASAERSRELRRARAELLPMNMRARHDLARGHSAVGEVHLKAKRPRAALEAFLETRTLLKALAAEDPENSFARKDLIDVIQKTGETRLALGEPEAAIALLEDALERNRTLLAEEPEKLEHHEHAVWSSYLLGNAWAARADAPGLDRFLRRERWETARGWYGRSRDEVEGMRAAGILTPAVETQFAACLDAPARADSALAALP